MRDKILKGIVFVGIVFLGVSAIYWKRECVETRKEVTFYEEVIKDFGLGEFVDYPKKFYNEETLDQAKKCDIQPVKEETTEKEEDKTDTTTTEENKTE